MQYKTIVMELIEDRPQLQSQLVTSRRLLSTINSGADLLREQHLRLLEELRRMKPGSTEQQLKSEAMELAVQQMANALPGELPASEEELNLDAAMAYVQRHTPQD